MKDIRGRCEVVRDEKLLSVHEDFPAFYCRERLSNGSLILVKQLLTCRTCEQSTRKRLERNAKFAAASKRLAFADYYSGAGGSVLSAKPFFYVVTAVEVNPVGCSTLS